MPYLVFQLCELASFAALLTTFAALGAKLFFAFFSSANYNLNAVCIFSFIAGIAAIESYLNIE